MATLRRKLVTQKPKNKAVAKYTDTLRDINQDTDDDTSISTESDKLFGEGLAKTTNAGKEGIEPVPVREDEMTAATPKDMMVEVDGAGGKTMSTLTICPNVASDGLLTVVQKSNLLNWAEEHFFPANKIMTVEEANRDEKLRRVACHAIGIKEVGWAIVGTEVIKRLRTAMSDRLSLHRKVVKNLYLGKNRSCKEWFRGIL